MSAVGLGASTECLDAAGLAKEVGDILFVETVFNQIFFA